MTLALNGTPSSNAGSTTASITTTVANCIIVLFVKYSAAVSTSVSGGGLTWIQRSTTSVTGLGMDMWYAVAPSAASITVTESGYVSQRLTIFAISGANTTTPFDTNGSLPATASTTSAASLSATISTNNANTMLIAGVGTMNSITFSRPSGFSQIVSCGSFADAAYDIVSSTQSSVLETYGSWSGGNAAMIIDAVQAAGSTFNPAWSINSNQTFIGA